MLALFSCIFKKKFKSKLFLISLSFFSISGCDAMKIYSPEEFFHGTQLTIAQAIFEGDSDAVVSLAKAADLNKPGEQDMTLLFYTLHTASGEKPQQLKIISELVKLGADPLQQVPNMGSVVGVVSRSSSPLYMKALLEGGMNPNSLNRSTPIIFSTADDDTIATMSLLVERGADVNKRDSLGATALMNALDGLQLDAVCWLLDHGADPRLTETNSGWSFSRQLSSKIQKIGGEKKTDAKLNEIINKSVSLGMKWPPATY